MSGKNVLGLLFVLGLLGLVYSIAMRLSAEALNVIVGVLCGVAASVPVSIGLLLALTRNRQSEVDYDSANEYETPTYQPAPYTPPAPPQSYPPIIVMAPPTGQLPNPYQLPPNALPPGYTMNEPPRTRDFKIIGEDDDDL